MTRQHKFVGGIVIVALGVAAWWFLGRPAAPVASAAIGADDVSVLVRTEAVRQQNMPMSMNVFGEVATGKPEALSFPQPGQIVQLGVVAGQQVQRGAMIATINSDPTAQTAFAQAKSATTFAQRELRRVQDLLALQLATQSQVDAARKQLLDAEATETAQTKLGGAQPVATLVAPFDGVVVAAPVGQGDRVQAGTTIVQLGRLSKLRILLAIEPAQSSLVKAGMSVKITSTQDNAVSMTSKIVEVQKLVDPKTQMVSAIVELPISPDTRLLSGMKVQAVITLGWREAWAIPRQAVLTDDKGAYLFQVANKRAVRVDVAKLTETGQIYGIDGKIDGKLPVVVLGNYELSDGLSVREGTR
ncbi:MAG: efflux RND transporter periplasmic adaptor subunit [Pseudomonadota bacterium]|nr:efflux RND transporter periplasmic adaptor subunit [Pseudomonadota bacterium]